MNSPPFYKGRHKYSVYRTRLSQEVRLSGFVLGSVQNAPSLHCVFLHRERGLPAPVFCDRQKFKSRRQHRPLRLQTSSEKIGFRGQTLVWLPGGRHRTRRDRGVTRHRPGEGSRGGSRRNQQAQIRLMRQDGRGLVSRDVGSYPV